MITRWQHMRITLHKWLNSCRPFSVERVLRFSKSDSPLNVTLLANIMN